MSESEKLNESPSTTLCKACGLCCSGHLFAWVRLNANELDRSEALGLNVIRNDPRQRGFTQPCPVWQGICTIYTSPDYPRSCNTYKCSLLRELQDDNIPLSGALTVVQEVLELIHEIDLLLPASPIISFREHLITHKENLEKLNRQAHEPAEKDFLLKAEKLLDYYNDRFGVDDFIDYDA